jgi:GNAT superfamily N-acetyltransferase
MKVIQSKELSPDEKLIIMGIWNKEYPVNLNHESLSEFESYLLNLKGRNHRILLDSEDKVKGWCFDFRRDNERWFAMILDSGIQGKGHGTDLLNELKKQNEVLNGWVIDHNNDLKANGDSYLSPLEFYLKNGFEVISNTRLELDEISAVKIKWERL